MVDFSDDMRDRQGSYEPPDATRYASEPPGGYEPHPLFPREDGSPEHRDIQFVSFRRRRSDGRIDNSAEDIPAGEIHSWGQVIGPWGGGEYKAIGKDKNHRVVAWCPEKNGEWLLFDQESKPFTLRDQRYAHSPPVAAPAPAAMAAPPAPITYPAPSPAPAPHHVEAVLTEVLIELREMRSARVAAPVHVAAPAPAPSVNDLALVEMIKSQGELLRTVMTQRPVEASSRSNNDPMAMALQILGAFQKFAPQPQAQPSVSDRLGEYRAIRELTTPTAAAPVPTELGELKDFVMSFVQADALSKTTRDLTPPALERRPPPPRPPPPRAPLLHVPGLGMVEVVQREEPPLRTEAPPPRTEAPPPRSQDRAVDYATVLRDPDERRRLIAALEIEKTERATAPSTPVALPEVPALEPPRIQAPIEPGPDVSEVAASPNPEDLLDAAWDLAPEPQPTPLEVPPIAPIVVDERPAIELPEHMPLPSAESPIATEAERQLAEASFPRLAKLPRDQLRVVLSKLPGVGENIDEVMNAVADLPPSVWPYVVANLPGYVVRALASEAGG